MSQLDNELHSTTFVLGAGFSKDAGLPVSSDLYKKILSNEFDSKIEEAITQAISDFLFTVFGWQGQINDDLPSLEDIFTCIDLSESTGHNLGYHYKPNHLRALRRLLIHRIFSILDRRYEESPEISKLLRNFCIDNNSEIKCNFIVLNWDIVLENHLRALNQRVNYCIPCYDWYDPRMPLSLEGFSICKMHGSSNWVYCDNCKSLFYSFDEKLALHLDAGLNYADFKSLNLEIDPEDFNSRFRSEETLCKLCKNKVSTHIATFSYRKSFRTAAYSSIWYQAEKLLADSDHWIFIGYSLPDADYEFKHLLKSAQIRNSQFNIGEGKKIDVVTNDRNIGEKYKLFFGHKSINNFHCNGLKDYVSELNR